MSDLDYTHLHALELALSHERVRLEQARTDKEKELRMVWIMQYEKEIRGERVFLGLDEVADFPDDVLLDLLEM